MSSQVNKIKLIEHENIRAWLDGNGMVNESGQRLEFKQHRYLADIYKDSSPFLCCIKAGQIGFSTMAILKTLWLAYYKKMRIGYVLPTADMAQKFVSSKVNPICHQNEIIFDWMADKNAVEQKQVGSGFIHYLGAQKHTAAIMLTMDLVVLDEYDKSPPEVVETFDSRLQHSEYKWKWIFSNPSQPDFGVDIFWKKSDQKKWYIEHSCGGFPFVLDESCIDYEQEKFICPHCKKEITDEERRLGEWISTQNFHIENPFANIDLLPMSTRLGNMGLRKKNNDSWSGYWIPLWLNPKVTAKEISKYKKEKTSEYFANFVAGLPYIGGGNKVYASTITKCLSDKVNDQTDRVIIGVDTGLPIHYVLANKQGYFYYGKCSDPTTGKDPYLELEGLLKRFPNSIMVSDQGGDLIGIRNLQAKYPGRVFLVWYRADQKGQEIIKWGENDEYGKVIADRNRLIQLFIDEMTDKRVTFNGTESDWQDYITHWLAIYRTWDENTLGVRTWKWERNGADHYCFDGNTKVRTVSGNKKIKNITPLDLVETRKGYEYVERAWLTKVDAETITAIFSNGSRIIATPNHKFITKNKGETTLDSIAYSDKLYGWNKSHITKLFTDAIRNLKGEPIESISPLMERLEQKGMLGYISKYGLTILAQFPKVLSFITKTAIRSIMKFQTWLVYQEENIKVNTLLLCSPMMNIDKGKIIISKRFVIYLTLGERLMLVKNGIQTTLIKVLYYLNQNILIALSAVLRQLHKVLSAVSFVEQDVVLVGTHENIGLRNVYNITVSPDHEYYANDILVSNCHATVYCRIGLDKFQNQQARVIGSNFLDEFSVGRIYG